LFYEVNQSTHGSRMKQIEQVVKRRFTTTNDQGPRYAPILPIPK
jgi:hypothetical protein